MCAQPREVAPEAGSAGRPEVYVHDDEWSISTEDGSLAAHFEHTVAITASGPRILTESRVPLLR